MLRFGSKRLPAIAFVACMVAVLVMPQVAAAATIKVTGSTTVQPLATEWATAYRRVRPADFVVVAGGGSGKGWTDVRDGVSDIGMSSREPKSGTFEAGLYKVAVAKDVLTVVVNPANPVRRLTAAQIKDMYTGKITNWKQVGGKSAPIVLAGRTGASGTYEYFKTELLGGSRQSARTKAFASSGMVRSYVARDKNAIGYVGIAFINRTIRGVTINGVAPTKANALAKRYPYVRDLYFITKTKPSGSVARFVNWCLSSAGQAIAGREYLPIR